MTPPTAQGVEEELYNACIFTLQKLQYLAVGFSEIRQVLLILESIGPNFIRQAKAIALVHDKELEPVTKVSVGILADIGVTLKSICSACEKRNYKGLNLGRNRLSELLELAEVKSETLDAPSYLEADTEDDEAYNELIREWVHEIMGLSTTFTALCSGFSLQVRLTAQHKMESQIRERQEEHTRVTEPTNRSRSRSRSSTRRREVLREYGISA
ncbi:hypothetical protein GT037_000080 [Alternaria burnsii]|uniref:Uncharacterized protein n=1 Tax=Alternaria burnsii TaxID=1187904 RepID=A0A8H7BCM9_9PLEO|nr:uncharacterized protein GT037_000080 [Alternaria burnsii]KAF7681104.1 hypothetical protein GT037_000080 [Alternaria burnsii]